MHYWKKIIIVILLNFQNANSNPDYCKLFRGRPLRFILPLHNVDINMLSDFDLIELNKNENTKTKVLEKILVNKKRKLQIYNEYSDKILQRKSAAFKLTDDKVFVMPELLCDIGCETPRINYDYNLGKYYRYFYAICSDVDRDNAGMVSINV